MIISFLTVNTGARYSVIDPDAESKVKPETLTRWEFDARDETTGSLIETGDTVIDFSLRRDSTNQINENAYETAYRAAYGMVHLRSFSKGDTKTDNPTKDQMLALPGPVLNKFFARAKDLDWQEVTAKKAEPGDAE